MPAPTSRRLRIEVPEARAEVSAALLRPADARALYVLGHGAGAGMHHRFMRRFARGLAKRGIGSLRYQFPYMERGGGPPDRRPILIATVRAALRAARPLAEDAPLLAGGKSMGGRMTSLAAAEEPLSGVDGLCFIGFPLHPPGRPGTERGHHLREVGLPMLFVQGSRDRLADLELLRPVLRALGERATLQVVEGADHGFAVLRRSGRTDEGVMTELVETVVAWVGALEA